jgi:hypothetical protein
MDEILEKNDVRGGLGKTFKLLHTTEHLKLHNFMIFLSLEFSLTVYE